MNLYQTIFHSLIVTSLNGIVILAGPQSRSANERAKSPSTSAHFDSRTQNQSVEQIHPSETTPFDESEAGEGQENVRLCRREENILLIAPKTSYVDAFLELQGTNIDYAALGVLHVIELRHSSALVECSSKDGADELQKAISDGSPELDVRPVHFCCHVASINDLPREVEENDIIYIMFAKYRQAPTSIRFVPYAPGWKEDVKIALIDVHSSLLDEIEASPKIPIQWIEYTINILLQVETCFEDSERSSSAEDQATPNHSSLLREMVDEIKYPLKINHISKFSFAEELNEEKSTIEETTKTGGGDDDEREFTKCANDNRKSFIPPRDGIDTQKKELPETIGEEVRITLAKMLPLAEQSLLEIVDKSIDKALAALLPLLKSNNLAPEGSATDER